MACLWCPGVDDVDSTGVCLGCRREVLGKDRFSGKKLSQRAKVQARIEAQQKAMAREFHGIYQPCECCGDVAELYEGLCADCQPDDDLVVACDPLAELPARFRSAKKGSV